MRMAQYKTLYSSEDGNLLRYYYCLLFKVRIKSSCCSYLMTKPTQGPISFLYRGSTQCWLLLDENYSVSDTA